jgi:hypothetical protein
MTVHNLVDLRSSYSLVKKHPIEVKSQPTSRWIQFQKVTIKKKLGKIMIIPKISLIKNVPKLLCPAQ